jgi:hypothetical protein
MERQRKGPDSSSSEDDRRSYHNGSKLFVWLDKHKFIIFLTHHRFLGGGLSRRIREQSTMTHVYQHYQ